VSAGREEKTSIDKKKNKEKEEKDNDNNNNIYSIQCK
jgi:hypothetical protein